MKIETAQQLVELAGNPTVLLTAISDDLLKAAAEIEVLVKRARMENHLAVRALVRIKASGFPDVQAVAMPRFVRNNLMLAARRLKSA